MSPITFRVIRKGGILGRPGTSFDSDTGITPLQPGLTCLGGGYFHPHRSPRILFGILAHVNIGQTLSEIVWSVHRPFGYSRYLTAESNPDDELEHGRTVFETSEGYRSFR